MGFSYDNCGNPTTYKGEAMSWERGRLLKSYKGYTFNYDVEGERLEKSSSAGTTKYHVINGKLIREVRHNRTIEYLYNDTGVIGCVIDGTHYYYAKNMFGDVVALIRTSDNTIVAQYVYDAWGNHKVYDSNGNENTDPYFVGNLNPIRYRSYYWDSDVQLYYLHTRWYDPEIGRFINLDQIQYLDPEAVNGLNLYAYCLNNPVMWIDPYGTTEWWEWLLLGGAVAIILVATVVACVATGGVAAGATAVAVCGTASYAGNLIEQTVSNGFGNVDIGELAIQTYAGELYGLASIPSGVGGMLSVAGVSSVSNMAMTIYENDGKVSIGDILLSGYKGFTLSILLQGAGIKLGKLLAGKATKKHGFKLPNIAKKFLVKFLGNLAKLLTDNLGGYATDFLEGFFN